MNHPEHSERLVFTESPRSSHLFRIWQNLSMALELPQVDRWLAQYFRSEKRFGKKDRQWYADAIFTALRFGPAAVLAEKIFAAPDRLQELIEEMNRADSFWLVLREMPAEKLFFWLSLYQLTDSIRFPSEAACLGKLSVKSGEHPDLQLLGMGIPNFYAAALQRRQELSAWDESTRLRFLQLQREKAPLWLRLNHPEQAEAARKELLGAGVSLLEQGDAWQVESSKSLLTLRCIEQGVLEIQDLASQSIGAVLQLEQEPLVWDCCAGGGGKTMQIASRLRGKGLVFASDIRHYKLTEVERRAQRAGFSRVRILPWDGEALPAFPLEWKKQGGVDIVLIDAPCTATGTWRRSPDSKYRSNAAGIVHLQTLQKSLFAKVLPALKPGGQLVYATCSWLPEENEDVIQAALEQHPELQLERMQLCGSPTEDSDTMFYAVLRKRL
jgi:16S rRNA (cytosine967-C5)-methyltransferase